MNVEFMPIDTPLPPCMPFPRALTGYPVSRRKLPDRECFVTSFRQGSYTPLRRLCGYPLWTCRLQTA